MGYPLTAINQNVHWKGSQVDHAQKWSINPSAEIQRYIDNTTSGLRAARPGPGSFTGSFVVGTEAGGPPCLPNHVGELKLYVDDTNYWKLTKAVIVSTSVDVDSAGNVIAYNVNFEYAGGDIVAPDGTVWNVDEFDFTT